MSERLTEWIDKNRSIAFALTYDNYQECLNKLAHYEDMEEQGRLIDLPCKVGDTVFSIENAGDVDNEKWIIEPFKIMSLHHIAQLIENNKFGEDYGVFLTRTEAEAKLKEMEKNNAE